MNPSDETNGPWEYCYRGIAKCNTILHYIEDIEVKDKNRFIAEAKFFRGFYYFFLVRYFENIPLITKVISSMNEAFEANKQVSPDLVYDQILKDLNDAKELLPVTVPNIKQGRITQGAARATLAKVLMWRKQYKEAQTELETVVNSKAYLLLDEYSDVFDINKKNNEEMILSVQYMEGAALGLSSNFMYQFLPFNIGAGEEYSLPHPVKVGGGVGFNVPTGDLIRSFEKGDVRKNMIDTTYIDHARWVYNDSIVPFTKKFWDSEHSRQGETGVNFPIFRYPHVLLMLAECYFREGGGDPIPLVNTVRERAKLPPLSNVTLDDIIHERRVEFHCECDRWDVLVRTGKAKEVMLAHGENERKRPYIQSNAYREIKLLFPIPEYQIEVDPTMEQNSEYK